jgi:hypothetical protein
MNDLDLINDAVALYGLGDGMLVDVSREARIWHPTQAADPLIGDR